MIGSKWEHPKTGEVRYYIDRGEAAKLGGLEIGRYKTGNISWAVLDGEEISNSEAGRILSDVEKIYCTEDGKVHIKWSDPERIHAEGFWMKVAEAIEAANAPEFAEDEAPEEETSEAPEQTVEAIDSLKEQSIRDGAYNLYDGGWRAEDRDQLRDEYGLGEEELDIIVDQLQTIEDKVREESE